MRELRLNILKKSLPMLHCSAGSWRWWSSQTKGAPLSGNRSFSASTTFSTALHPHSPDSKGTFAHSLSRHRETMGITLCHTQPQIHTEAAVGYVLAVALGVFTIRKAGIRLHRFFQLKDYRISSLSDGKTIHCAALRRAELAVIVYHLWMEASPSSVKKGPVHTKPYALHFSSNI